MAQIVPITTNKLEHRENGWILLYVWMKWKWDWMRCYRLDISNNLFGSETCQFIVNKHNQDTITYIYWRKKLFSALNNCTYSCYFDIHIKQIYSPTWVCSTNPHRFYLPKSKSTPISVVPFCSFWLIYRIPTSQAVCFYCNQPRERPSPSPLCVICKSDPFLPEHCAGKEVRWRGISIRANGTTRDDRGQGWLIN